MWAASALYSSPMLFYLQKSTLHTYKLFTAERQTICSEHTIRLLILKAVRGQSAQLLKSLRLERESICDGPPVDYWGKRMGCIGNY